MKKKNEEYCKFINRNLNTITVGGSGQGKSYSELFPNALNANSNYVFCDPSGEIYRKIGRFLRDECGYKLKVFNVKDFRLSMRYNPLAYIETEKDINVLVDAILANIDGGEKQKAGGNDFFDKAAKGLLSSIISLLFELYPDQPEKRTFMNIMELLRMAKQITDDDGNVTSELVKIIERLEEANPRSYARKLYRNFEVGGPKVCNEIIISATTMLGAYFDMTEMNNLTMTDELHLEELATETKCALFLTIPQDTTTYNFMSAIVYTQLFSIVTKYAERYVMVPRHISFWLDEFANCGRIPYLLDIISVTRNYNVSINIIIQMFGQLKQMYGNDSWEIILGNCDTLIYHGEQAPSDNLSILDLNQELRNEIFQKNKYK